MYSAVILAKNDARTISDCIKAVKMLTSDIIVVLDDRSNDNTGDLAAQEGATIYSKKWEGFSKGKNYGASLTKHDWILCPDADEILDDNLIQCLNTLKPELDCAYLMNRCSWFADIPVRHSGWFPDWNIRLYNKTVMHWDGKYVHERLTSKHTLKHQKLSGIINHFSFIDESHMQQKFDYYAQMRAKEWKKSGKTPPMLKRWFGPAFRFFRTFIIKCGFLDGKTGYIIAKNEYILKRKEWEYYFKG